MLYCSTININMFSLIVTSVDFSRQNLTSTKVGPRAVRVNNVTTSNNRIRHTGWSFACLGRLAKQYFHLSITTYSSITEYLLFETFPNVG